MSGLVKALRVLITVSAVVGVLAFAAAALLTVGDIIGRQMNMPLRGMVDLVQLCILGGAWLVIPYTFLTGGHVGVDLLVDAFPPALRASLRTLAGLAAAGLLLLMLVSSYGSFQQQLLYGDRSQQLGIPIAYYWVPLLAGVVLSIVAVMLTLVSGLRKEATE